jgi:DNA-binding Xre family transcriptional regulator
MDKFEKPKVKMRTIEIGSSSTRKKKRAPSVPEPEVKKTRRAKAQVVEEKEPVRRKKKTTELVLPSRLSKNTISKMETDGSVKSILGDSAEVIQQMLESGHNDSATSLIHKRLLQSLVDLIPYAENNIRESKGARGVYQINSLITSIRELMIDAQSTKDRGALGDALVEKVIRPTFLDIGMELVQEDARLSAAIKDLVTPAVYRQIKVAQKESLSRIAHHINQKYTEAKEGTVTFLQT